MLLVPFFSDHAVQLFTSRVCISSLFSVPDGKTLLRGEGRNRKCQFHDFRTMTIRRLLRNRIGPIATQECDAVAGVRIADSFSKKVDIHAGATWRHSTLVGWFLSDERQVRGGQIIKRSRKLVGVCPVEGVRTVGPVSAHLGQAGSYVKVKLGEVEGCSWLVSPSHQVSFLEDCETVVWFSLLSHFQSLEHTVAGLH